ncbi:unnamed protein product [Amoebophrya sp. A25]|nr:unnamed protein product [Amoebophrya sp. A25]|eukprot:GSA25T00014959001.1
MKKKMYEDENVRLVTSYNGHETNRELAQVVRCPRNFPVMHDLHGVVEGLGEK